MSANNFLRMMRLIDEVFATREDPEQLQVTGPELEKLRLMHPATLSEVADENGPLIWCLIIPTTIELMDEFIAGRIGETQLLERTPVGAAYNCIYLCSVTTLPEVRGKGRSGSLCLEAIARIRQTHHIRFLFVWPFSTEGDRLAESLALKTGLPLRKRGRA